MAPGTQLLLLGKILVFSYKSHAAPSILQAQSIGLPSIFLRAQPCCSYKSRAITKFQLWEQTLCTSNFIRGCTLLVKNTILSFKVIYISLKKKINKNNYYCKAWPLTYCLWFIDPQYLRILFWLSLQASGISIVFVIVKKKNNKSRLSLIVRVNVVLNRTVVVDSDWRGFDNLCGSHLQSQSESNRGPCVRKLFTGLIMYLPSQNKEHCIVLYFII